MKDFFAAIYEIFIAIYGNDLAQHLYGFDCNNLEGDGLYGKVGILLFVFTLIFVLAYYFRFVHPGNNKWHQLWLRLLLLNAIIHFLIGFGLAYKDLVANAICQNFIVNVDNTVFFGIVNAICAIILFFIFSNIFRWVSTHGRLTPYPK